MDDFDYNPPGYKYRYLSPVKPEPRKARAVVFAGIAILTALIWIAAGVGAGTIWNSALYWFDVGPGCPGNPEWLGRCQDLQP